MKANPGSSILDGIRLTSWAGADLPIDWRSYLGSRGLLVVIIHGTWCHACLERLVWLRRRQGWLNEHGIGILAVSADDPTQVEAFLQSSWPPLPFTLLSDADAALSWALGLRDDDQAPRPALLLIDCSGELRFSQIDQHDAPAQAQALLQDVIEQLPPCD